MNKKISKVVGLKIKSLRERHGMSGKELGLLLGISQQHQSRYENGQVNIYVDTLYQLAQIFDINPEYFFSDFNECNKINELDDVNKNIDYKKSCYEAEVMVF
nr:helix-turn-helix transcriptional regulator [uncultured Moellerella sp.]